MIEALKAKAVQAMLSKIGETVESNNRTFTGLVKLARLDSDLGKIKTALKRITLYLPEENLDKLGGTVIVRNEVYEVVTQNSKSEYNGFAKVELTEITAHHSTPPIEGEWR